jgi:hypothetical protein
LWPDHSPSGNQKRFWRDTVKPVWFLVPFFWQPNGNDGSLTCMAVDFESSAAFLKAGA